MWLIKKAERKVGNTRFLTPALVSPSLPGPILGIPTSDQINKSIQKEVFLLYHCKSCEVLVLHPKWPSIIYMTKK